VSCEEPNIAAVRQDGSVQWIHGYGVVGDFALTAGSDGWLYAACDDGYVLVVDANGGELARFRSNDRLCFPVIAGDGVMYVSDANNRVWAIEDEECAGQEASLHRPGDVDLSWTVDFVDYAAMADEYGLCSDARGLEECERLTSIYLPGDVDRDLYVDIGDVASLVMNWLDEGY
jgi:hypothetical protein